MPEVKDMQTASTIDVQAQSMSASWASPWYYIGPTVSRLVFESTWPAAGSPVGVFALELTNDRSATTGIAHPDFSRQDIVAGQPSGTNGTLVVDNIRTAFSLVRVTYTRTSGGEGATPTVRLSLKRGG